VISEIPDWKRRHIESLQEAVSFFSNAKKLERECWVVAHFLKRLGITFNESEIVGADEPADVAFRTAQFQVKELVPTGRRRQNEYREKLKKATLAENYSDLTEQYTPGEISFSEIVESCNNYTTELIARNKYGIREISSIDILLYFNNPGIFEVPPESISFDESQFRSVSMISNRYASVLYASVEAPEHLIANKGVVHDYRSE